MVLFFCRMGESLKTLDYDTDGINIMDSNVNLTSEERKKFTEQVKAGKFISED
jgi:hypothetical protein